MHQETHHLILTKSAQRTLQEKVINNNLAAITDVCTRSMQVRGWTLAPVEQIPGSYRNRAWRQMHAGFDTEAEYIYEMHLMLNFEHAKNTPSSGELRSILNKIAKRAIQPSSGGKWVLQSVDGEQYIAPGENDEESGAALLGYADIVIPDDWDENFSHLYGLDAHIARIKRAIQAGIMSDWTNRYHCALMGPPGCGKSDICGSLKRALGEDAVLEFDATATTQAGAINDLSERDVMPRILLIEEIEKADENSMRFLLGVLDLRGEIRKTTARAKIQREAKLFAVATVNDVDLFNKLQAGALSSRFSNKLWFKHPSRELLTLILKREIAKVEGDPRWIDPALDYCEEMEISDPRAVSAICLCGREMLLTGEYQAMMSETSHDANVFGPTAKME